MKADTTQWGCAMASVEIGAFQDIDRNRSLNILFRYSDLLFFFFPA